MTLLKVLLTVTSNKKIMKEFVNTKLIKIIGIFISTIIIILNFLLLILVFA